MVYGHYYRTIAKKPLDRDVSCARCEVQGEMKIEIVCKVSHIMFIPVWASKKEALISCNICASKYYPEDYPQMSEYIQNLLKIIRYPWYYYSGFILGIIFFLFCISLPYFGKIEEENLRQSKIENIQDGQVIFLKLHENNKTSMYVDSIAGDTLFIRKNRLSTQGNPYEIDEPENYEDERKIYTKEMIREMNHSDQILDIALTTTYFYYKKRNENI